MLQSMFVFSLSNINILLRILFDEGSVVTSAFKVPTYLQRTFGISISKRIKSFVRIYRLTKQCW